ncbi:hypothetical protein [Paenibacillus sp.]|uniref:hypothetical protein n=1 Tax=Paenibacillus sp. TaxID=58172 RepID=UPI002D44D631|nr:hypothetical protein [Paenibacillus sp.]HZG85374.1 hypothetical protein [Paenibacillus sp.]
MFICLEEVKRCADEAILEFWCKLFQHDVLGEGTRPSQDPDLIAAVFSEMSARGLYADSRVRTEFAKVSITPKHVYYPAPIRKAL